MFESVHAVSLVRNLAVYGTGVAFLVIGALGISAAIEFSFVLSAVLFLVGLVLVISVHEFLGGPV